MRFLFLLNFISLPLWPILAVSEVANVQYQPYGSNDPQLAFKNSFSEALSKLAPGACITQRCDKKGRRHVNDDEAKSIAHCILTSNSNEATEQFPESRRFINGGQSGLYYKCTMNEGYTCTDKFFAAANAVHDLIPPMLVTSPQDFTVKGLGSLRRSALILPGVVGLFTVKVEEHGTVYYDGLKSRGLRCSGTCFDVRPSREQDITRDESKLGHDNECRTVSFPSA